MNWREALLCQILLLLARVVSKDEPNIKQQLEALAVDIRLNRPKLENG